MYVILKHLRFKHSFIMYVKTLLFSIQTCVINNWHSSDYFSNYEAFDKHALLNLLYYSSYSFEIMAVKHRENKNIRGIQIKLDGKLIKNSHYLILY